LNGLICSQLLNGSICSQSFSIILGNILNGSICSKSLFFKKSVAIGVDDISMHVTTIH
jgi:hypothetical protein